MREKSNRLESTILRLLIKISTLFWMHIRTSLLHIHNPNFGSAKLRLDSRYLPSVAISKEVLQRASHLSRIEPSYERKSRRIPLLSKPETLAKTRKQGLY